MKKLSKAFDHSKREQQIYEQWENNKLFHADASSKKEPFSIVIPPPNVTGSLHIGHALDNTLQDIIVRYNRMSNRNTLWMPGTDHAGIATQNVIEKQLLQEGKTRQEIGRDKFLKRTWEWKEKAGGRIITQLKRLGASCDWDRERFTMDEGLSSAVRKVFVDLYNEDLIYRDNYIINWCPRCLTALSDLEVEQKETKGKLYYIKYPSKDGNINFTVATTRPETMLGDTAIAVNPEDRRFSHLIGKTVVLPLANREIPVIADERVEKDFGTGTLKITPAHDFTDFEIGKTHNLDRINVFTQDGKLNEKAGRYKGLNILDARQKVLEDLRSMDLLEKIEDYKLIIGNCYRCKATVEPRMSRQWFVKIESLAKPAIQAVKKGETRIIPKTWQNTYFDWMENIRDWCISRQLWWGHRIPAWYCKDCDEITVSQKDPDSCEKCSSKNISQDPDVLDTWFSSALWPFSTMGWPEKTNELKTFYPTSLLITGFDIIFFWVARMMMMGIKFMGQVPFRKVYIHALIRDEHGKKMSKSKGNVVDPLEIMEKFGTDAFRFTLAILTVQGRDVSISEKRIVGYRNFINKLWNASKFVLGGLDEKNITKDIKGLDLSPADTWILTRTNMLIDQIKASLEEYRFNEAASAIYKFIWHELCDWYIELSKRSFYGEDPYKKRSTQSTLLYVLDRTLRIAHPFIPYVTEEIYSHLPGHKPQDYLMISPYPERDGLDDEIIFKKIEFIKEIVSGIRNLRMENLISPMKKLETILNTKDKEKEKTLREMQPYITALANCSVKFNESAPKLNAKTPVSGVEIILPVEGLINVDSEVSRLNKEIKKAKEDESFFEKRLANKGFMKNASPDLIEKNRTSLKEAKERLSKLTASLDKIKGMKN